MPPTDRSEVLAALDTAGRGLDFSEGGVAWANHHHQLLPEGRCLGRQARMATSRPITMRLSMPARRRRRANSGTRLEANTYASANFSETDLATGAGKTADSQMGSPRANDADQPEGAQALESNQSRPSNQDGVAPAHNYATVNPGETAPAGDSGTRLEAKQYAPVNSGETGLASTAQQIADTPQTSGAQTSGEVAAIAENARDDARLLSADASQKEAGDVSTVAEGAPSAEAQEPPEALNLTGERDPASGARGVAEPYPADLPGTAGAGQSGEAKSRRQQSNHLVVFIGG